MWHVLVWQASPNDPTHMLLAEGHVATLDSALTYADVTGTGRPIPAGHYLWAEATNPDIRWVTTCDATGWSPWTPAKRR